MQPPAHRSPGAQRAAESLGIVPPRSTEPDSGPTGRICVDVARDVADGELITFLRTLLQNLEAKAFGDTDSEQRPGFRRQPTY